jgi:hypothetical protein
MAEFTPLSSWQHLQDTKAANEIVQAYNERRQCVDPSFVPVDLLGAESNAQDTAFWKGIQQWVLDQVQRTTGDHRWLDHEQEIEGESSLPFYTLSAWEYNSGLDQGFRRATTKPADWTDYDDPAYSYGVIQAGDIRGPWIFEDLQKGLDALRWTQKDATRGFDIGSYNSSGIGEGSGDTLADAITNLQENWDVFSLFDNLYVNNFSADDSAGAGISAFKNSTLMQATGIKDHINHVAYAYLITYAISGFTYLDEDYPEGLNIYESLASAITTTRATTKQTTDTSTPPVIFATGDYDARADDYGFILKWEFSHTL